MTFDAASVSALRHRMRTATETERARLQERLSIEVELAILRGGMSQMAAAEEAYFKRMKEFGASNSELAAEAARRAEEVGLWIATDLKDYVQAVVDWLLADDDSQEPGV